MAAQSAGEGSGRAGRTRASAPSSCGSAVRTRAQDLEALRTVKKAIGPGVVLMVDFNQGLSVAEAIRRGHMIDDEGGVHWIEEPIRADDFSGCSAIRKQIRTPIQIGENFMGPEQMAQALAAGACDYVMPDAAAHRRRDRLDARRGARAGRRDGDVEPPVPGGELPSAGRHADLPLARIRGLGGSGAEGAGGAEGRPRRSFPTFPASALPGTSRRWRSYRFDVYPAFPALAAGGAEDHRGAAGNRLRQSRRARGASIRERAAIDYYGRPDQLCAS